MGGVSMKLSIDGPQPKKRSVDIVNSNNDYISNLPADLKERILMKLSIKEAVRTIILSNKWKDSWTSIPKMRFIGRKRFKVPSRFFSCSALKSVELSNCIINVPQFFNGFTLLHTLDLHNFDLKGFDIQKLVSSCPLLDYLSLDSFHQPGCLNITASNLTSLDICGEFYDICLETPKLSSAMIEMEVYNGDNPKFNMAKDGKESNITRAVGHLSNIQKLDIYGDFLDYLGTGPIPVKLPTIFNHLKEICMDLRCLRQNEDAVICLFQSAPNIQLLDICFRNNEVEDDEVHVQALWELKAMKDDLFKRLETLNISYLEDAELPLATAKSILGFVKFVLSTAPALEKLTIIDVPFNPDDFPKLSTKAENVFL